MKADWPPQSADVDCQWKKGGDVTLHMKDVTEVILKDLLRFTQMTVFSSTRNCDTYF